MFIDWLFLTNLWRIDFILVERIANAAFYYPRFRHPVANCLPIHFFSAIQPLVYNGPLLPLSPPPKLAVFLSVCLSVRRITQTGLCTNFDEIFGEVGCTCMSSTSWLGFYGNPHHNADTGIYKRNFYHCGIAAVFFSFKYHFNFSFSYSFGGIFVLVSTFLYVNVVRLMTSVLSRPLSIGENEDCCARRMPPCRPAEWGPKGRKSRLKAESGGGVLGEAQQASSPPARGSGSAVSSPTSC